MRTEFKLYVSPTLAREVAEASAACDLTPHGFILQVVQAACAERRLVRIEAARLAGRKLISMAVIPAPVLVSFELPAKEKFVE